MDDIVIVGVLRTPEEEALFNFCETYKAWQKAVGLDAKIRAWEKHWPMRDAMHGIEPSQKRFSDFQ